jgi:hypothetical protein
MLGKMRQVLWPKYLLGGMMQRGGSGTADAEQGGVSGFVGWLTRDPSPATHRSYHPAGPRRHPASVQRVLECYHTGISGKPSYPRRNPYKI